MRLMSAREAAEKWGVTLRRVQLFLHDGRVEGAQKCGAVWLIPADAEKPRDPRKARGRNFTFFTLPRECPLLTMTTLYSASGSGDAAVASLARDGAAQTLFSAQLSYLRGEIAHASALLQKLPEIKTRSDLQIGACFLSTLCALYRGDTVMWQNAKRQVAEIPCRNPREAAVRDFWLGNIDLELYDIDSMPAWFCDGDFEMLPLDCYPMARYAFMKYHMLRLRNAAAARIARPFISQCRAEGALVSEIYCRLMIAVGDHEEGLYAQAAEQLDRVLALALPDRLYAPLAEYRDNLGTMLDERLLQRDRNALKAVLTLSKELTEGWTKLNREIRGVINTVGLTPRAHHAAKLAALGLSNSEIAERMRLSVNTVKHYISDAMTKTGAKSRNELARFLAMEETEHQN